MHFSRNDGIICVVFCRVTAHPLSWVFLQLGGALERRWIFEQHQHGCKVSPPCLLVLISNFAWLVFSGGHVLHQRRWKTWYAGLFKIWCQIYRFGPFLSCISKPREHIGLRDGPKSALIWISQLVLMWFGPFLFIFLSVRVGRRQSLERPVDEALSNPAWCSGGRSLRALLTSSSPINQTRIVGQKQVCK